VRVQVRVSLVALVVSVLVFLVAGVSGASAAGFGFAKFFAGNCNASHQKCGEGAEEGNPTKAKEEGFTQAGGFVPFGVTDFRLNTEKLGPVTVPAGLLTGESLTNLRVDVAPGVVTNPQAVEKCSMKNFLGKEVAPGVFTEPSELCDNTIIGENKVETVLENTKKEPEDVKLSGNVYNLEQTNGQGSTYGVALVVGAGVVVHTIIQGSVEYNSDYHDYFIINNISPGLIESRLVFFGNENVETGEPNHFIRNPTKCT
jgi:hypothetical protein